MSLLYLLRHSPDIAVLCCTAGILLIYLELNRPGRVLPGSAGLLLALLAVSALLHMHLAIRGLACLAGSAAVLAVGLRHRSSVVWALVATMGIFAGCLALVRGPGTVRIHAPTAAVCSIFLGTGTWLLTRIARRARINKGLD